MVNTNSKEFREKVQAYIRRSMSGYGGTTALFRYMEQLKGRGTPYHGAYEYVMGAGGGFLVYNSDIVEQLKRWGLTDEKKLWNYRTWKGDVGPMYLYAHLIAINAERMYENSKKGKPISKPAKKKATKRRV